MLTFTTNSISGVASITTQENSVAFISAGSTDGSDRASIGVNELVASDANVSQQLTVGTGSTLTDEEQTISISSGSGSTDAKIVVGTGVTITGNSGIISAIQYTGDGVSVTGVVTAQTISADEFIGTGDNLIFSPVITSFSPVDNATSVSGLTTTNISLTYDQPIGFGTDTITLRTGSASGTIVESYEVGVSTRATINNQTLTIVPSEEFDYDTEFYFVVPEGSILNRLGGRTKLLDTYNFTTEAAPVLQSFTPSSGSVGVATDTNVVLTFDKGIRLDTGTITLRTDSASGSIIESYDVTSSNRLTVSSNTLTIDPTTDLDLNQNYYVVVPSTAVVGYAGTDEYEFTTIAAGVTGFNPADETTEVQTDSNIAITFDRNISAGLGTGELRTVSASGSIVESYEFATSPRVTFNGATVTIDPTSEMAYGTVHYFVVDSTAVVGYGGTDEYNFTTEVAPVLQSFSPADEATNVAIESNIVLTFDKNIEAGPSGTIELRTGSASGTIVESYDVTSSSRLTFSGTQLTINPTSDMAFGTVHYVVIPNNAIGGYSGTSTYNFTTETAPVPTNFNPADGATNVSRTTNFVITFNKTIERGTGTIRLRRDSATGTIIQSYDAATNTSNLTFSGSTLTINPSVTLDYFKQYYPVIPSGAVFGWTGTSTYNARTVDVALGQTYCGGPLICQSGGTRWVVSPAGSQVIRTWNQRGNSNQRAQAVSGFGGWFVPSCNQLQNPGYRCRTHWDNFQATRYWSNCPRTDTIAWSTNMGTGQIENNNKLAQQRVRSFKTVAY